MLTHTASQHRATRLAALGLIYLLLVALAAPAQAAPAAPDAVGDSVTWNTTPQIVTNVVRADFARVAVASNGKTHIVYISKISDAADSEWQIRYVNNLNGPFNSPGQLIDTIAGSPSVPSALIIAGANNVLHLAYTLTKTDDKLYYRQSTNSGTTWSARQEISTPAVGRWIGEGIE